MGSIPLPEILPLEYKLLLWIIAGLLLLALTLGRKLLKIFSDRILKLEAGLSKNSDIIDELSIGVKEQSLEFKQAQVVMQEKLREEIRLFMKDHSEQLILLASERFKQVWEDLQRVKTVINRHDEIFKKELEILKKHSSSINEIKTELVKIGKDIILVKTKKGDGNDK